MFVVPKLYHQYRYLFDSILGDETKQKPVKSLPDVCKVMKNYWTMIKARNEVFCGTLEENELKGDSHPSQTHNHRDSISSASSPAAHDTAYEEHIVHVLDNIGRNIDSATQLLLDHDTWIDSRGHSAKSAAKSIFGTAKVQPQTLTKIVNIMCHWASSESRYGDWKAYLVASILLSWRETHDNKAVLQDSLIQFLDDEASKRYSSNDNPDSQTVSIEESKFATGLIHKKKKS